MYMIYSEQGVEITFLFLKKEVTIMQLRFGFLAGYFVALFAVLIFSVNADDPLPSWVLPLGSIGWLAAIVNGIYASATYKKT